MENWPGDYAYTVEFCKAQDKTKATPWVVSIVVIYKLYFLSRIYDSYMPSFLVFQQAIKIVC